MPDEPGSFLKELQEWDQDFLQEMSDLEPVEATDTIQVDARLDHFLERVKLIRWQIQQNEGVAKLRAAEIEDWKVGTNRGHERRIEWLESEIERLTDGYDYGRKKSRKLPNGSFGWRSLPDKIDIVEPGRAIAFAESRALDVTVEKRVSKTTLMKHVEATGEIPDVDDGGFLHIEGGERFFIKATEMKTP